jgi:hypothetical protein
MRRSCRRRLAEPHDELNFGDDKDFAEAVEVEKIPVVQFEIC